MIGFFFAPESPWWLVREGRFEDARRVVLRLTRTDADEDFNVDETIAMMVHTNAIEQSISVGTSYLDCFKGVDARRTEIASMTWAIQSFCGSSFMGYSTYFYQNAGLLNDASSDMSIGQFALAGVGTVFRWLAVGWFGRCALYIVGLNVMFILLLVIGFVGIMPSGDIDASWVRGSMLFIYTFVYDLTVGPVRYSLVAEIPSTDQKAKAVLLACNFYNMAGIINKHYYPSHDQTYGVELGSQGRILLGRLLFCLLGLDRHGCCQPVRACAVHKHGLIICLILSITLLRIRVSSYYLVILRYKLLEVIATSRSSLASLIILRHRQERVSSAPRPLSHGSNGIHILNCVLVSFSNKKERLPDKGIMYDCGDGNNDDGEKSSLRKRLEMKRELC